MKTQHYKKSSMRKTKSNKRSKTRTYSNTSSSFVVPSTTVHAMEKFQKQITIIFFEMLLMIKLYHWKTHNYATHKATDELYSSFNKNMDRFIEVLLGKTGTRIDLMDTKHIELEDLNSQDSLKQKIHIFKRYLVSLDTNPTIKLMNNHDLLTIRDEMLADMNQFLYLLTLK